jgi:hypothetical protein
MSLGGLEARIEPPQVMDLAERTTRAAVEAAVFAERARCAKVARNAWMQWPQRPVWPSVCDEIATLIETIT